MPVKTEIIPYAGWDRNLRLSNDACELIITLDVGPRVLSYRTATGKNIFKVFFEELGQSGEDFFRLRGGHRLWTAPEDLEITYHKDNEPVDFLPSHDDSITLRSRQRESVQLEKDISFSLDENTTKVTVGHLIKNSGTEPLSIATWALSILEPGGIEIIPQPAMGEHPRDLLPNRNMVSWPYTDLSDERYRFGTQYLLLRQMDDKPATKIGLLHTSKWVAYICEETLFIKTIEFQPGQFYPDMGCNFETFTETGFLEMESLGPLVNLEPGESTGHSETWHIFDVSDPVEINSEESLCEWLRPFLVQAGLSD